MGRTFKRTSVCTAALAVVLPHLALAYNSEEHKILANMGAANVVVPPSVTFQAPTGFQSLSQAAQLQGFKNAKRLAVGFSSNNTGEYSDQTKKTQDNSYWYTYTQRDYNLHLWIPPTQYLKDRVLMVEGRTHNDVRTFQFGELVALYGDYRKTTHCVGGDCYLTNDDVWTLGFSYGQDCFGVWPFQNCGFSPDPMDMAAYLRDIGSGIWPPYRGGGNTFVNTAYEWEWNDAGWWGDEMIRIANINEWHFSQGALGWYIGLHREALLYVDSARYDPAMWNVALHYEANALHSLTDLFAFGHIATNRDQTSWGIIHDDGIQTRNSYIGQQQLLTLGGVTRSSNGNGTISLSPDLPAVTKEVHVRNDFQPSYRPARWDNWAYDEHTFHEYFNTHGAEVRNLLGQTFFIYGDSLLRSSSDETKTIIAAAVTASLQSLFDAYEELDAGTRTVEQIAARGSNYFAALKHIPVFVNSDHDHYFDGMWTRYAVQADEVSGAGVVPAGSGFCTMPYLNGGSSWPPVQSSPCTGFPTPASVGDDTGLLPGTFGLNQNYPNPFNPSTDIEFSLPAPGKVSLVIYNLLGQQVRVLMTGMRPAGIYDLQWDGRDERGHDLPSGLYLYRLSTDAGDVTKKMTLLR